jgi:hypothetical protein
MMRLASEKRLERNENSRNREGRRPLLLEDVYQVKTREGHEGQNDSQGFPRQEAE